LAVWHATHTHLYPGARLRADSPAPRAGPLTIEFADLASAPARLAGGAGRWRLHVAAHRTQPGTAIAAKAWHVEPLAPPEPAGTWRVVRRAA
jgi:hypothetical protein